MGAISSGKTICGTLFAGTVFLGCLHGVGAADVPQIQDPRRSRAIVSVKDLFQGFTGLFGDTDCQSLTGCDWGKPEDVQRYREGEVFQVKCRHYIRHVLAQCLSRSAAAGHP